MLDNRLKTMYFYIVNEIDRLMYQHRDTMFHLTMNIFHYSFIKYSYTILRQYITFVITRSLSIQGYFIEK